MASIRMEQTRAKKSKTQMEDIWNSNMREIGWVESSDSEAGGDPDEFTDVDPHSEPAPPPRPFPTRAPIPNLDLNIIFQNRDFWSHCLVGFLIDSREFDVPRLQFVINTSWHLMGRVLVVGRDDRRYIVYFEYLDDIYFMFLGGPWSVHSALLAFIHWEPNMVINRTILKEVPRLWVQFRELPLEYQIPRVARNLGELVGGVIEMGHVHGHCPWTREKVHASIENHMSQLIDRFGINIGISMTKAHFMVVDTPGGHDYRPWTQLPMDFEWDRNEILDINSDMVPLGPPMTDFNQEDPPAAISPDLPNTTPNVFPHPVNPTTFGLATINNPNQSPKLLHHP
ncbi:Pyruvate carboxyltransferase [Senna tora]|uniref:Pyruvate carboxyltransferase n=1 Tax=Senna tora TaxID=362788 RepID=A0A834XBI3_9FABA|nr:Pyruvate carboxyltransferase [Senna tora]